MKMWWVVMFFLIIGVRIYKLDTNSHFVTDESRDLVHMHQIFVEKKLTLVGPISDDRSHVFSSLTYYMLLPFTALFNFDPVGPVVGMVWWGTLTAFLMAWNLVKSNKKLAIILSLLAVIWWPLVQTSRWAWNPNLVVFWLILGWTFRRHKFISGLSMGLAVHHHYVALLPISIYFFKFRSWRLLLGMIVAWVPFVVFDLRHPPGLFVLRNFIYVKNAQSGNFVDFTLSVLSSGKMLVNYFIVGGKLGKVAIVAVLSLIVWDLMWLKKSGYYLTMWIISILGPAWLSLQEHYLLPAAPFFALWLGQKRKGVGQMLVIIILILIGVGSVSSTYAYFREDSWVGNLRNIREVTAILAREIERQKLVNPNIAVLASEDNYTNGNKYRDLLLVRNIRLRSADEYGLSDNLFVVSRAGEERVRDDPAAEMVGFSKGPLYGKWYTINSSWVVYQFNRY